MKPATFLSLCLEVKSLESKKFWYFQVLNCLFLCFVSCKLHTFLRIINGWKMSRDVTVIDILFLFTPVLSCVTELPCRQEQGKTRQDVRKRNSLLSLCRVYSADFFYALFFSSFFLIRLNSYPWVRELLSFIVAIILSTKSTCLLCFLQRFFQRKTILNLRSQTFTFSLFFLSFPWLALRSHFCLLCPKLNLFSLQWQVLLL